MSYWHLVVFLMSGVIGIGLGCGAVWCFYMGRWHFIERPQRRRAYTDKLIRQGILAEDRRTYLSSENWRLDVE